MSQGFLWPLRSSDLARLIAGLQYVLRVERGTTESLNFPVAPMTANRNYWLSGDGQGDADGGVGGIGDLAAQLAATLNSHSTTDVFQVLVSASNRLTIVCAAPFRILWGDAATTLSAVPFGFAQTTPGVAAFSSVAPNQSRGACTPVDQWTEYDSRPIARAKISVAKALSGRVRHAVHAEGRDGRELRFHRLQPYEALREYAQANEPTGTFEHMLREALRYGRPVRFYEELATRTAASYWLGKLESPASDRREFIDRDPDFPAQRWAARFQMVAA